MDGRSPIPSCSLRASPASGPTPTNSLTGAAAPKKEKSRLASRSRSRAFLAELTTTPEVCWIYLWEGFGGLDLIPGFDDLARVRSPGRRYDLFRGPIDVMTAGTDDLDLGWPDYP